MSTVISASEAQPIVKKVYRSFFSPSKYEAKSTDQAVNWPSQPGEKALPFC
jgi:hypothetical protein